ncbi:MAG: EVE domain-containing protein [Verrucomicrobia bacterium]|nr:EVE domain-containing protein [Verrucomicrobiota bacterium]
MPQSFWIVKQEPSDYSWEDFVRDGGAAWTGVRNFAARLHLRAMKPGDLVFFYHSGDEKRLVGLARVKRVAYPDPTATEGDWSAVDLEPVKPLANGVTLAAIKSDPALEELPLVKISRLSVSPVNEAQARRLIELAGMEL